MRRSFVVVKEEEVHRCQQHTLSKIEKKRKKQELLEARMREALGKDFKLLQDGKDQGETSNFTSDDPNADERG